MNNEDYKKDADMFDQFFSGISNPYRNINHNSNCETCGYKSYSDKIKYIKEKMKKDKALALDAENRKQYLETINKSYCEILKYIRNI